MSGERRILRDAGGVLADIVDGLHDVTQQLAGLPYALVGGVAVLVHVQGHRVTQDIDSAVRALKIDVHDRLRAVADEGATRASDALVVLTNGVPVDVLTAGLNPPRRGIGVHREAKAHATRWAIETAAFMTIEAQPSGRRGSVVVPVASPAALVAMKAVASSHGSRGAKRASDLLDLWRLLSDDPVRTAELLGELRTAPDRLLDFTSGRLRRLMSVAPADFVRDMASGTGRATSAAEVRDLYHEMVAPELTDE